jgi:aryl-alcohol dehydrogenase-like predicted oxidoreductase
MTKLPGTELDVFDLCLGGNVFGWTADEDESFAVLDAYRAAGGNFIDTADVYSAWVPGNSGGESETILGRWMAARGNRDDVVIATKVGSDGGLAADNIARKAAACRDRLGVSTIDLLYAHKDDPETPLAESLEALDGLVREGHVRHLGLSNYSPARLSEALVICDQEGFARPVSFQPQYNLVERGFEDELQGLCAHESLAVFPYYGLASGFLTGKYRPGRTVSGDRSGLASAYLDRGGDRVLAALDEISAAHGVSLAAVALAWLRTRPTVLAPIASARTTEQLAGLLEMVALTLSDQDLVRLDATAPDPV